MSATVLIIPGLGGSGPDHWQSLWQRRRRDCLRVEQARWDDPHPAEWTAAIAAYVAIAPGPIILVAHSLGCAAVAHWAATATDHGAVAGALLVAPCDVDRPDASASIARFAPMPAQALPFRSTVVASRTDAYVTLARAACFAANWGSAFVDAGALGHINAASGLGDWDFGIVLLDALLATADADRTPYRRAARLTGTKPACDFSDAPPPRGDQSRR
jgi:hypothetical protein